MCNKIWPEDACKFMNGHKVQFVIPNTWLNDLIERQLPKDINNLSEAEKEALQRKEAE